MNNSSEKSQKETRLSLGENICPKCQSKFILEERKLAMPGTKDLESVFCPYCKAYCGEVFINGIVHAREINR